MGDATCIPESQFDGSRQHLLTAWPSGPNEPIAVKSPPTLGDMCEIAYQPIEMRLILFGRRIRETGNLDDPSARILAQCSVKQLVIHKDHVSRIVRERIPTGQVFRTHTQCI